MANENIAQVSSWNCIKLHCHSATQNFSNDMYNKLTSVASTEIIQYHYIARVGRICEDITNYIYAWIWIQVKVKDVNMYSIKLHDWRNHNDNLTWTQFIRRHNSHGVVKLWLDLWFKGYKEIKYEDSQAANEPGQMFDDECLFGAPQWRQDHNDTQPIRPIAHHGEGKQQVRGPLRRLSLELEWIEVKYLFNRQNNRAWSALDL